MHGLPSCAWAAVLCVGCRPVCGLPSCAWADLLPFSLLGLAVSELIGLSTGRNLKGTERTKPYHGHLESEVSSLPHPCYICPQFISLLYVNWKPQPLGLGCSGKVRDQSMFSPIL